MNLIRGILSIGIIIACMFNWVDFQTDKLMYSVSGLAWVPSTILLYLSVFTAGYAFYNSYRNSNQNAWIYLISGLYGTGVSVFIYVSVMRYFHLIYTLVPSTPTDEILYNFGLGLYLTGLFSFLLFLTGFDKSENKAPATTFHQQYSYIGRHNDFQSNGQENVDESNLEDWLKENPAKSINDYFSRFERGL